LSLKLRSSTNEASWSTVDASALLMDRHCHELLSLAAGVFRRRRQNMADPLDHGFRAGTVKMRAALDTR